MRVMSHYTWAVVMIIASFIAAMIIMVGVIKTIVPSLGDITCVVESSMAVHHQSEVVYSVEDCNVIS